MAGWKIDTCKDIALAQQLLYLTITQKCHKFVVSQTALIILPALGAAQIGNIVTSQSHTLSTFTTLVSCCVIDGQVLKVLAGKCRLCDEKTINWGLASGFI